MNAAAARLGIRVMAGQLLVAVPMLAILALLGPRLLLVDREITAAVTGFASKAGAFSLVFALALVEARLRTVRFVLRALALGSTAIEPEDVAALTSLPRYVTSVTVLLSFVGPLAMATPLRPAVVDFDTALGLTLLGLVIVATSALPLYVVVRAAVSRAIELVPPDTMRALLEQDEPTGRVRRRILRRLLAATATPIGFVAVGAALIAHAHVRTLDEASRERTAEAIARVALEPSPGAVAEAGRADAMRAAAEFGFQSRVEKGAGRFSLSRGDDGRVTMTTPVEDGLATVRFAVTSVRPLTGGDVVIALLALLLASALGLGFGRSLSRDLGRAALRVRTLSTEDVLRGHTRVAPPARWDSVLALNRAIDTLAERFGVFAGAQERALEARRAAQRTRSLLFASVSHDLRSPLNAILGFTALVGETALTSPQRESLGFIEQRGRELLALIETILDVARAEAGKLQLSREPATVASVVAEAVRKGRERVGARRLDVLAEVPGGLPLVDVDPLRLAQALAALVDYAARVHDLAGAPEGSRSAVLIRAQRVAADRVQLDVEHQAGPLTLEDVTSLLLAEPLTAAQRRYGGLTLGLSLARALVELHGARLKVERAGAGRLLFRVELPVGTASRIPPRPPAA